MAIYVAGFVNPDSIKSLISNKTNLPVQGYRVVQVDAIPRNESGKVDYALLKEGMAA